MNEFTLALAIFDDIHMLHFLSVKDLPDKHLVSFAVGSYIREHLGDNAEQARDMMRACAAYLEGLYPDVLVTPFSSDFSAKLVESTDKKSSACDNAEIVEKEEGSNKFVLALNLEKHIFVTVCSSDAVICNEQDVAGAFLTGFFHTLYQTQMEGNTEYSAIDALNNAAHYIYKVCPNIKGAESYIADMTCFSFERWNGDRLTPFIFIDCYEEGGAQA